jgi:uncharacterized protein (TIGR03435 family)
MMLSVKVVALGLIGMSALAVKAQPESSRPEFEVVSIKPNVTGGFRSVVRPTPGGLNVVNASPLLLIRHASDIEVGSQIESAPSWAGTARYDILAKGGGNSSRAVTMAKLKALLENRFDLKVHWQVRETPVFFLKTLPGGPKVPAFKEGDCVVRTGLDQPLARSPGSEKSSCKVVRQGVDGPNRTLDIVGATPEILARVFSVILNRIVIDQMGLKESMGAFHLEYAPEDPTSTNATAPSILTAVQEQAGLKLQPGIGPVKYLIVDHIEKPTAN